MLYIFASPWDSKEIQPVNPKGNQSWIFIGRTDPEAEAPVVWPPDAKSRLIGKDPSAGKDCDRGTGVAEDEMVGWHHRLNGQEFEQTLGDSEGQGSLNSMDKNLSKLWEILKDREAQCATVHGVTKSQTWLRDWTTTKPETNIMLYVNYMPIK